MMPGSKAGFVYVPDFVLKSGFLVESREKLPPKDLPNPCKKPSSVHALAAHGARPITAADSYMSLTYYGKRSLHTSFVTL